MQQEHVPNGNHDTRPPIAKGSQRRGEIGAREKLRRQVALRRGAYLALMRGNGTPHVTATSCARGSGHGTIHPAERNVSTGGRRLASVLAGQKVLDDRVFEHIAGDANAILPHFIDLMPRVLIVGVGIDPRA